MQKTEKIEILELGIAREVESVQFYLALAEYYADSKMRQVFIDIAEEEVAHKGALELEIIKCGYTVPVEQDWPLIDQGAYKIPNNLLSPDMQYKDFLLLAIEKEEAAFRLYIDLLTTTEDNESREVIIAIAQEEVKHKYRFEMERDYISRKK